MSPELIAAVKERIEHGYEHEAIRQELLTAGHSSTVIEKVLKVASAPDMSPVSASQAIATAPLSIVTLFKEGWAWTFKRYDLLLALWLPLSVVAVLGSLVESVGAMAMTGLASVAAMIFYALAMGATLYIITNNSEDTTSLTAGLNWTKANIWGLLWVYILVAAITYGGSILFIIPGIIVAILTFFTPYVYVKENKKGLDAVLRSRDLVKGRWGQVFFQLFKLSLIFIGLVIVLAAVLVPLALIVGESAIAEVIVSVFMQLFSTIVTLIGLYVGSRIYQNLVATSTVVGESAGRWKYKTLAWLGLLLPMLLIGAAVILISLDQSRELGVEALLQQQNDQEYLLEESPKERLQEMSDTEDTLTLPHSDDELIAE